jgi:hypothetical protein
MVEQLIWQAPVVPTPDQAKLARHEQVVRVALPKLLEMIEQLSWQAVPVQAYPVTHTQELTAVVPATVLLMPEQLRIQRLPFQM